MNDTCIYDIKQQPVGFVTVLESERPLTKTYRVEYGHITKGQIVRAPDYWTATTTDVANLEDLYEQLLPVSKTEDCIIIRSRGKADRYPYTRRNQKIFTNHTNSWVMCDFDDIIIPGVDRISPEAIEWLIHERLPVQFHNADYIYQWSVSSGLHLDGTPAKEGTSCHVFFYLNSVEHNDVLKGWLLEWERKQPWFTKKTTLDLAVLSKTQPIFVSYKCNKPDQIGELIPVDEKLGIVSKHARYVILPDITLMALFAPAPRIAIRKTNIDVIEGADIIQQLRTLGCIYREGQRQ